MRKRDVSWLLGAALLAACGTTVNVGEPRPSSEAEGDPGAKTPENPTSPPNLPPPSVPSRPKTFGEEARDLGKQWTWLDPQPSGEPMYAVAGTSMSDLFYAGTAGAVLHWNGVSWNVRETADDVQLDQAWAPKPGAVWVAGLDGSGKGHLYRVDGATTTEDAGINGFPIQTLTGLGESRAWAVGPRGEVRSYDGTSWTTSRAASDNWLRGIHALGATNVWAVGDKGEIVHFDGTAWTTSTWDGTGANPFDSDYRYEGVWGASPTDLWAVAIRFTPTTTEFGGQQYVPVFSHFDGSRWSVVASPNNACGSQNPYNGNNGSWWGALVNYSPAPEKAFYDLRRPFGQVLIGTDAANVVFQGRDMCPWRFDGTRWSADPTEWYRSSDGALHGFYSARSPSLAALAGRTIINSGNRLDLSGSPAAVEGASPRWRTMRPMNGSRTNVVLDQGGSLWSINSSAPAEWSPSGWDPFHYPSNVHPTSSEPIRQLFVRNGADLWTLGIDRNDPYIFNNGVLHWNGSAWQHFAVPEGYRAMETVRGNHSRVWASSRTNSQTGKRLLSRLGASAIEASVEITEAFGFAHRASGRVDLLADSTEGERVLFAYTVSETNDTISCFVGSWDGATAPRQEILIEHCDSQPVWLTSSLHARLFRLADGTTGLLSPEKFTTWSGTTAKTRFKAIAKTGSLTVQASASTATLANPTVHPEGQLQDLVHAGGNRYWILAGGGLFLWDASTDEIAFARHSSGLTSLVSAENGEVWAVGPGLLHFTPPPPSSKAPTK